MAGLLAGCGDEECSLPRRGDEQSCDSYDGGQWSFVPGDPLPDLSAYCASQCVDVFAPIAIAGYADLRKVPLLPKVRLVNSLRITLDGLRDLRGLEKVDVVRLLTLSGLNGDSSPKTLEGLSDQEMDALVMEQVTGLATLEGASFKRVDQVVVSRSSVQTLDLSGTQMTALNVPSNRDLRSLANSSGALKRTPVFWILVLLGGPFALGCVASTGVMALGLLAGDAPSTASPSEAPGGSEFHSCSPIAIAPVRVRLSGSSG